MASGLKIKFKKSKGISCCKDRAPAFNSDVLKQLKWRSDFIDILNIPFGSKQEISRVFSAKISSVKNEVLRLKKIHSTFHAKSVIVKMKILLLLSFFSRVYLFPNSMISKLNRIVQNFVTPKPSSLTIFHLSKTRESGGYDILDIPLYLQLLYTKQLNQYYLYKTEQYDRLPYLLLMECNAGRLLSSKFGLKISNTNKPQLLEPSYFYKQFLEVMNKYNIGKNEIQTMKLCQMYY